MKDKAKNQPIPTYVPIRNFINPTEILKKKKKKLAFISGITEKFNKEKPYRGEVVQQN